MKKNAELAKMIKEYNVKSDKDYLEDVASTRKALRLGEIVKIVMIGREVEKLLNFKQMDDTVLDACWKILKLQKEHIKNCEYLKKEYYEMVSFVVNHNTALRLPALISYNWELIGHFYNDKYAKRVVWSIIANENRSVCNVSKDVLFSTYNDLFIADMPRDTVFSFY